MSSHLCCLALRPGLESLIVVLTRLPSSLRYSTLRLLASGVHRAWRPLASTLRRDAVLQNRQGSRKCGRGAVQIQNRLRNRVARLEDQKMTRCEWPTSKGTLSQAGLGIFRIHIEWTAEPNRAEPSRATKPNRAEPSRAIYFESTSSGPLSRTGMS